MHPPPLFPRLHERDTHFFWEALLGVHSEPKASAWFAKPWARALHNEATELRWSELNAPHRVRARRILARYHALDGVQLQLHRPTIIQIAARQRDDLKCVSHVPSLELKAAPLSSFRTRVLRERTNRADAPT